MTLLKSCASFMTTGSFRPYADGQHVAHRRLQKCEILRDLLESLELPTEPGRYFDFGCADGAIPVTLLESDFGPRIADCTGVTLLDYNEEGCDTGFSHPRVRSDAYSLR